MVKHIVTAEKVIIIQLNNMSDMINANGVRDGELLLFECYNHLVYARLQVAFQRK